MAAPRPMRTCCCGFMELQSGTQLLGVLTSAAYGIAICLEIFIFKSNGDKDNPGPNMYYLLFGSLIILVSLMLFLGALLSKRLLLWPFMITTPIVGILLNFVSAVFNLLSIRVGIQTKNLGATVLKGLLFLTTTFVFVYFWVVVASLYIKLGDEYDENADEEMNQSYRKSRGEEMMANAYSLDFYPDRDGVPPGEGRSTSSRAMAVQRHYEKRRRSSTSVEHQRSSLRSNKSGKHTHHHHHHQQYSRSHPHSQRSIEINPDEIEIKF